MTSPNDREEQPRNAAPRRDDTYFEKIVKYIPADILAAYMTFSGIIADDPTNPVWLHWACFAALTILTPLYTIYRPSEPPPLLFKANKTYFCAVASTLSFAVWCFALGGPFAATFAWYRPVFGSLLLILTTLLIPILEKVLLKQSQ